MESEKYDRCDLLQESTDTPRGIKFLFTEAEIITSPGFVLACPRCALVGKKEEKRDHKKKSGGKKSSFSVLSSSATGRLLR